jgi:hypothetical protein
VKSYLSAVYRTLFGPLIIRLDTANARLDRLEAQIELTRMQAIQSRIHDFRTTQTAECLRDVEFRVFSQWGEDGIIQYLLSRVPVADITFVELGVEDYRESNTRFLLMNNNWRGLIVDRNAQGLNALRSRELFWRYSLTATCAFITRDNVNQVIEEAGVRGDIGLLSVDVDGNDYWIWKALTVISPRIVIVEYNSLFGSRSAVTIPYSESFSRTTAHASNLYWGASLAAMCRLAGEKGYVFAGSNSAGCNAFFVRRDVAARIAEVECAAGFVESRFRESRDGQGRLTFLSGSDRLRAIGDQMVVDLDRDALVAIRDLPTP